MLIETYSFDYRAGWSAERKALNASKASAATRDMAITLAKSAGQFARYVPPALEEGE